MPTYLALRLEGPLQAWGDVALDPVRPTRAFPSRSALAGLLASALGWRYRDAERTTALQDAIRYAVREDRVPTLLKDFQTADLGRETAGWTRWGIERRGGGSAAGTQILEKFYLAHASFAVALSVEKSSPVSIDELELALRKPARPLFLGRRSCPPSTQILEGRLEADSPFAALYQLSVARSVDQTSFRCWYEPTTGPINGTTTEIWDRRDYSSNRFAGSRRIVEGRIIVVPSEEVVQ